MSKGGGQTTSTEERTESSSQQVQLGEELRNMSVGGLMDAYNLYNQGTEGIYQGTRLADQDALVGQGEQALLELYGAEGGISNLLGMGQELT